MEKNKMGYMPIPKLITTMSLPVIFSMLVQALYNVVDSIFVSRISEQALTALSLAFPMQIIVIAAFVGLSTGINSAISRRLGEKKPDQAALVAEHGVFIAAILYVFVALIGGFVVHYIYEGFSVGGFSFNGFTDNQTIIEYSITYLRIVMIFSFGSIFNHAGMSIFRGTGDMIRPMIAQLMGAILNMILDPILIFGWFGLPAMGVQGAAIATVTAQVIAMIFTWSQLLTGKSSIKMQIKKFKIQMHTINQIISVGIPSAIMQGLSSVMLFSINLVLSRFGDTAIAVMGIYFRVQSLVFMPLFGLSIGTMPVVGFNFGARNKQRIKEAIRFSILLATAFMSLCFIAFQIFPKQILSLFNASEQLSQIGVPAIRTISLLFPIVSVSILLSTAFQAFGKAYYSLIISIIRQLAVLVPAAFILASYGNVDYVWYAFLIAEVFSIIITTILFSRVYKKNVSIFSDTPLEQT